MPRSPESEPLPWPMFVPPPAWFALALAAGWAIDRWEAHVRVLPPAAARGRVALAIVLAALAVSVAGSALYQFRRARATILPVGRTGRLVTDGIFRVTRNPMYLAMTVLYLAAAIWLDTAWPIATLPLALFVIAGIFVPYEERRMHRLFGPEYELYRSRVRRWL